MPVFFLSHLKIGFNSSCHEGLPTTLANKIHFLELKKMHLLLKQCRIEYFPFVFLSYVNPLNSILIKNPTWERGIWDEALEKIFSVLTAWEHP
jgi:hypothetical protein